MAGKAFGPPFGLTQGCRRLPDRANRRRRTQKADLRQPAYEPIVRGGSAAVEISARRRERTKPLALKDAAALREWIVGIGRRTAYARNPPEWVALCASVPDGARRQLLVAKWCHFGLFYGRIWRSRILPAIGEFMSASAALEGGPDRKPAELRRPKCRPMGAGGRDGHGERAETRISLERLDEPSSGSRSVEIVERKELGHPDWA